jgi:hypothetical protein
VPAQKNGGTWLPTLPAIHGAEAISVETSSILISGILTVLFKARSLCVPSNLKVTYSVLNSTETTLTLPSIYQILKHRIVFLLEKGFWWTERDLNPPHSADITRLFPKNPTFFL